MQKIVGIGNALVDVLIRIQTDNILRDLDLPKGSMQLIDEKRLNEINARIDSEPKTWVAGGSSANTMAGLGRLGNACGFIAKTGNDTTADIFLSDMKKCGVDPILMRSDTPTGTAITFISSDGERTFGTFLGAAAQLSPEELRPDMFSSYSLLYIEGYLVQNHALIERAASLAKTFGLKIAIDLASYNVVESNLDFLIYLIKEYAHIVFANQEEAKALTGKNPAESLKWLAAICDTAIVKMGAEGALIQQNAQVLKVSAIPAIAVDTTGAGDLYAAGFLHGFANGKPLQTCGEYGSLLAGSIVEVVGSKLNDEQWVNILKKIN
jgi:sugar/nucleoside kinase (ribokinase family)